jgi:hypothetical protein
VLPVWTQGVIAMRTHQNKSSRHLGFDIGKNTLHLVGLDGRGAIVLRRLATAPAAVSSWWPAVARTTSPARSEQA